MKVDLDVRTGDAALQSLDQIRPIYAEVYVEPPYCETPDDVDAFADGWRRRVESPGFRLVLAWVDEEAIGFTFGHELTETTRWWDGALTALPESVTREWNGRTFAVIELAVKQPWRRQGVGRLLHQRLLADIGVERVTLLVRPEPEAAPARAAYKSWGYQKIGQIQPGSGLPVYNALVLDSSRI